MSFLTRRLLFARKKGGTGPAVTFNVAICSSGDCCQFPGVFSDDCSSICDAPEQNATVYASVGSQFVTGTTLYADIGLTQIYQGAGTKYNNSPYSIRDKQSGQVYAINRSTGVIGAFQGSCSTPVNIAYCSTATCCQFQATTDDCFNICTTPEKTATVYIKSGSQFFTGTKLYADAGLTQIFVPQDTYRQTATWGVRNLSTVSPARAVLDVTRSTGVIGAFRFYC